MKADEKFKSLIQSDFDESDFSDFDEHGNVTDEAVTKAHDWARGLLLTMRTSTPTMTQQEKAQREYWWVAVNGASAALSSFPFPITVKVIPTPEQLFGFSTYEAAKEFQTMLLTAPMAEVRRRAMQPQPPDVVYIRPRHPEPPTRGATMWLADTTSKGETR